MARGVNDLERIRALIHAASERAGSQGKLARLIGYEPPNVTEWLSGKRSCPVQAQALMAELVGLDAEEVTLYAIIQGERNPQRKQQLMRVLGKGLHRMSGAAFCAISASALWVSDAPAHFIRCIERLNAGRTIALTPKHAI